MITITTENPEIQKFYFECATCGVTTRTYHQLQKHYEDRHRDVSLQNISRLLEKLLSALQMPSTLMPEIVYFYLQMIKQVKKASISFEYSTVMIFALIYQLRSHRDLPPCSLETVSTALDSYRVKKSPNEVYRILQIYSQYLPEGMKMPTKYSVAQYLPRLLSKFAESEILQKRTSFLRQQFGSLNAYIEQVSTKLDQILPFITGSKYQRLFLQHRSRTLAATLIWIASSEVWNRFYPLFSHKEASLAMGLVRTTIKTYLSNHFGKYRPRLYEYLDSRQQKLIV